MGTVYVFLAEGFEEVEALTPVDFLRRANINVVTVGIGGKTVKGGQGIEVLADVVSEGFVLPADASMIVLPGGGLGTENLGKSEVVAATLKTAHERNIFIAAICAAPTVLYAKNLLNGKNVTAYPDVQQKLVEAKVTGAAVEVDGKIITGRSAGVALQFAHALTVAVLNKEKADEVLQALYP